MTGETYKTEYIRQTERNKALLVLAKAKAMEKQQEQLVKEGKLKKKIIIDRETRKTIIHYYV